MVVDNFLYWIPIIVLLIELYLPSKLTAPVTCIEKSE